MNTTDPIADLLTRIRNAYRANHDVVGVPASKTKIAIAHILKREGFIKNYKCIRDRRQGILKIALKYDDEGNSVITELKRISRPSNRIYVKTGALPFVKRGFGVGIVSTSKGIMTDKEARDNKIGGEYICSVF